MKKTTYILVPIFFSIHLFLIQESAIAINNFNASNKCSTTNATKIPILLNKEIRKATSVSDAFLLYKTEAPRFKDDLTVTPPLISANPSDGNAKTAFLRVNTTMTGIPAYCNAGSPGTNFEYISNVTIGSINQSSGRGINGYQDYTSQITALQIGVFAAATISVSNSTTGDQILIWVDWNQDGDFNDAGENVYSSSGFSFTSPHTTANFSPPAGANNGNTRMRIRLHDTSFGSNPTPCGDADYGEVEDYTINVSSSVCSPPFLQAIAFTSASISDTTTTIGWTRGNGDSVIVVARTENTANTEPVSGTIYVADSSFGGGSQLGNANYVVYKGIGNLVKITGLTAGTNYYYYAVYEYNDTSYCYKTPALTGNVTTTGTFQCNYCTSYGNMDYNTSTTFVDFNTITNNTAKPGGYNNYTALSTTVNKNSTYNLTININTDGNYTAHTFVWIDWNHDCDFSEAGEAYNLGTATDVSNGLTSLSPLSITIPATAVLGNTRMRISTAYNIAPLSCDTAFDGEVEDYTINIAAICAAPYNQATVFSATTITSSSMTIEWVRGNGTSVLVIAHMGSMVNAEPVNGTTYTANSAFGNGPELNSGNFVVYNGSASFVNISNLLPTTSYYFAIYEYNDTNYCYKLPALVGNTLTSSQCTPVAITTQPINMQSSCSPSDMNSFEVSSIGTSPITYQWQFNIGGNWINVYNGLPTGANYTHENTANLSVNGITNPATLQYRCNLSNCYGVNTATSNIASLTVNLTPTNPLIIQSGTSLLSDTPNGNQWYNLSTGLIPGANDSVYDPQQIGYYFTIVTLNGCQSDSSNLIFYDNTSITEPNPNLYNLKVFPNPFNGKTNFTYYLSESSLVKLSILDITGKELITLQNGKQTKGEQKSIFNANNYTSGLYFYKLIINDSYRTGKIVLDN